jgi:hypothetical protein
LNWENFQAWLTGLNIDDLHRDVLNIIEDCKEQKREIKDISEKLDVVSHVLTDTTALKNVAGKIDARLDLLDKLFLKIHDIQKSTKKPSRNIAVLEEFAKKGIPKAIRDIRGTSP